MAKNRKYQSAAVRFGPAVKAFFLCLVLGGFGVGYVWQKNQIYELGQQIKNRELRSDQLNALNNELKKTLWDMRSQPSLEKQMRRLNLGLVSPAPSQVIRLPEPPRERARSGSSAEYAANLMRLANVTKTE